MFTFFVCKMRNKWLENQIEITICLNISILVS